jgi:hypothetical protein
LILGTSTVIPVAERIRQYSSIEDIGTDFGTDAPEYAAATVFFSQSPKPTMVLIGRWAKTLASGETGTVETMIAAVNACLQYTNWYGLAIADSAALVDADVLSVAGAIEASSLSRILAVTTSDVKTLTAGDTTSLGYKLKAAGYAHLLAVQFVQQVCGDFRVWPCVYGEFHGQQHHHHPEIQTGAGHYLRNADAGAGKRH